MTYALMLKDFDGLKKEKYYPIVDTLIDDGSAVVDLNRGIGKEELRCIPPEFYIPLTARQVAERIKSNTMKELLK
jgi:hypothetical protein